jgi:hypothetical protein
MPYADPEKRRAAQKARRVANQEKIRAYNRARYAADPARVGAPARAWQAANPEKVSAIKQAWRAANREKVVEHHLRHTYGLTLEQFKAMAAAQDGRCAICQRTRKLTVDHCHKTGKIRGLLCGSCNRALGTFGDNADGVKRVLIYLER